ncbi:MAG: hypothetical protein WCP19_09245 [Chloroflexota bacterium]
MSDREYYQGLSEEQLAQEVLRIVERHKSGLRIHLEANLQVTEDPARGRLYSVYLKKEYIGEMAVKGDKTFSMDGEVFQTPQHAMLHIAALYFDRAAHSNTGKAA